MSKNQPFFKLVAVGIALMLLPVVLGFAILFAVLARNTQQPDFDPRVRHPVTNRMISRTEKMATRPAPPFRLQDAAGRWHSLQDLSQEGPILLYFIGKDCPCSVDAEPMFNALAFAYPRAKVVGVINCGAADAKKWAEENLSNHPVLLDPANRTMADYRAEASVYSAVVTQSGKIVKMWPGYSQSIMDEISRTLADLTGSPFVKLDRRLAPKEMAAGCAFKTPARSAPRLGRPAS